MTKSNTLIHTLAYWDHVIGQVSAEFPDIEYRKMYVDAASANFVLHPEYFDVIVTTNMIGDILSDLGGAIMEALDWEPAATSILKKISPACLNRFTAQHQISQEKELQTQLGRSGRAP